MKPKKKNIDLYKDKLRRRQYLKDYNASIRKTVCTIRTNTEGADILREAHKRSGLSWVQILYRGLGLRQVKLPRP